MGDESAVLLLESRREAMLNAVAFAADQFLRHGEWRRVIDEVLAALGRAAGASRGYIFENRRDEAGELCGSYADEWVAPGVEPHLGDPDLALLPYEAGGFGRWLAELATGRPVAGDVASFPAGEREHLEPQGIRSLAVVPIEADGELWGFLGFDQTEEVRAWSRGEVAVLRAAAGLIGSTIGRERTEAMRRASEEALRLSEHRFARMFQLSPLPVCVTSFDDGRIVDVNQVFLEQIGAGRDEVVGRTTNEIGLWADLAEREALYAQVREHGAAHDLHARLRTSSGRLLTWKIFSERVEIGGRDCLLSVGHDVTAREEAERRLRYLAYHDPLTGLPNRAAFEERLDAALAAGAGPGRVTLLFLDLDRLKVVNDSLGHCAGDRLLIEIAERLRRAGGEQPMISRFGGDEFAVLLAEGVTVGEARRRARELLARLCEPVEIDGHELRPTASIGVVTNERGTERAADLLRFADIAMYRAKKNPGSAIEVFDVTRDGRETELLQLEGDLWRAVERRELALHFQPIHRLADGGVWGSEALLRWHHPTRGPIPPSEVIALAEESGAIHPLGEWVLAEACRQTARWQREHRRPDLRVSVNVSSVQLRDAAFPLRARRLIAESGVSPRTVLLELSENAMIEGVEIVETLRAQAGVRLAVDDFGTGYASLASLRRLPIDVLKVDRSFVRELPGNAVDVHLLESLQRFCASVGLETVAEGIETGEQAELLAALGYPLGQGYHFARPLPPEALGEHLRRLESPPLPITALSAAV